ncbi:hypothetical protein DL96DRAFT_859146 [Flagelloscypha sp. PMI_526]|nr:hypothetical protein DL96DRAFT_859146 [Flagelloscypha sp. PMI_526]
MEEVFSIPELCALIFIHCNVGTCARLARTAKIFLEPSLDRIWEHLIKNNSVPLFKTIANPEHKVTLANYHTLHGLSKRVRTLWTPTLITYVLSLNYFEGLHSIATLYRTVPPLFEKLQVIAFEVELGVNPSLSEKVLTSIFLCSSIRVLHLSFHTHGMAGPRPEQSAAFYPRLITLLDTRCPSLQSLSIWRMYPSDSDAILSRIAKCKHLAVSLQHVGVLGHPRKSLHHLLRMKRL